MQYGQKENRVDGYLTVNGKLYVEDEAHSTSPDTEDLYEVKDSRAVHKRQPLKDMEHGREKNTKGGRLGKVQSLMGKMYVEDEAHSAMSDIEEGYEVKDDSRPFFQRQPCEAGIYMTVYEATPVDKKSIGLPHFFRMHTTDILYDEFRKRDTVTIRAEFEHRDILTDTYIERFEPGIVMAVGFDSVTALDSLWTKHRQNKLTELMHDVLITSDVLQAASITGITIETKLWDDEYDVCKQEILSREKEKPTLLDIQDRQNDLKMVQRLKAYQTVIATELSSMRDLDNEMELNRTDFMNCIRNLLPNDSEHICTLVEYENLANSQKARKMYYKNLLDLYSTIIKTWREYYDIFELEIVTPFMQIHRVCENEKQRKIKAKCVDNIKGMKKMLRSDSSLQEVTHPEMEKKVIQKEAPVFLGLLSLVPLGVDRLAEIDILIDEYIREFKLDNVNA